MNYYLDVVKKYAQFDGRARRKEYWMYTLFYAIIGAVVSILDTAIGAGGIISIIYWLAFILPTLGVTVRRLHDTDRSWTWILITFVPIIGSLWLLVLMCLDSTPGENRFGENPKE